MTVKKVEIVTAANREESQLTYSVSTYDFYGKLTKEMCLLRTMMIWAYPMAQSGKLRCCFLWPQPFG